MGISISIPRELSDKVVCSNVYENYTAGGKMASYGVTLEFKEINQHRERKSRDLDLLPAKIEQVIRRWDDLYAKHVAKMKVLENRGRNTVIANMSLPNQAV